MALETLLDIFIRLADALAHAHEQGRVHRDLKPDNIMIEADGTPKILDFGLARIVSTAGEPVSRDSGVTSSDVPTRMDEREPAPVPLAGGVPSLTRGGQLVGTPQYMSPEQAEGEATDARTDIFSFGVVMYEAWTGQRPFVGKSLESIIGRILASEPTPVTELKPGTPYSVELLIRRCLRKKRDERVQSARELVADLEDVRRELAAGKVLVERDPESAATARPGKVVAVLEREEIPHALIVLRVDPEDPQTTESNTNDASREAGNEVTASTRETVSVACSSRNSRPPTTVISTHPWGFCSRLR